MMWLIPTTHTNGARDRGQDEILFLPICKDVDHHLPKESFPIIIVINGSHHFLASKSLKPDFNDGMSKIRSHYKEIIQTATELSAVTQDKLCKEVLGTILKNAALSHKAVKDIFKPVAVGAQAEPLITGNCKYLLFE